MTYKVIRYNIPNGEEIEAGDVFDINTTLGAELLGISVVDDIPYLNFLVNESADTRTRSFKYVDTVITFDEINMQFVEKYQTVSPLHDFFIFETFE